MNVSDAAQIWLDYHRVHSKKNTYRAYKGIITRFVEIHGNKPIDKIDADIALEFLGQITDGKKKFTKRVRYAVRSGLGPIPLTLYRTGGFHDFWRCVCGVECKEVGRSYKLRPGNDEKGERKGFK